MRLGTRGTGGLELVGEVVGVTADARVQLGELVAQFVDGAPVQLIGAACARSTIVGQAHVYAVEREVLVVAPAHGRREPLEGRALVAELGGLVWGEVGAVEFALGGGVDEEQLGGLAGA